MDHVRKDKAVPTLPSKKASSNSGASHTSKGAHAGLPPAFDATLDDFADDGSSQYTYSYASTWSTNYTMSNLPGPGRILGNLYSTAGRSLERGLGELVKKGVRRKLRSAVDVELRCSLLLEYARCVT